MTKAVHPPTAILVCGAHEFFVEEAAEEIRAGLGFSDDEIDRVPEEALASRLPEALASGSLFSSRRLVEADLSTLFGRASPADLLEEAAVAWEKNSPAGRREAFRKARALLAALQIEPESPEEAATAAARKTKRDDLRDTLAEILRELPDGGGSAQTASAAVLSHLEDGVPGTVLLARAVDPPRTSTLYKAFEARGDVRTVGLGEGDALRLLSRRARKLADEKKIAIEPAAIERLLARTAGEPRFFASELDKVLGWAGEGGKVRAADVDALVEDRRAEDVYAFFDAFGSRDRAETLRRLERVLAGKALRTGDREIKGDEPLRAFFGMLVGEVRRLLVVRARCDETRTKINPVGYPAYQAGVHPRLAGGTPLMEGNPFVWYKAYQRAARFSGKELVAALRLCAAADAAMKDSASLEDTIAALVSGIV
jgi:DNA polymerase III delta subunit